MRKKLTVFTFLLAMSRSVLAIEIFPATSASLANLRAYATERASQAENKENAFEISIGKESLLVMYLFEGSGIVTEVAFVYRCDSKKRCKQIADVVSIVNGADGLLSHEYDPKNRRLNISTGARGGYSLYFN